VICWVVTLRSLVSTRIDVPEHLHRRDNLRNYPKVSSIRSVLDWCVPGRNQGGEGRPIPNAA
jgi:hypothetical protein